MFTFIFLYSFSFLFEVLLNPSITTSDKSKKRRFELGAQLESNKGFETNYKKGLFLVVLHDPLLDLYYDSFSYPVAPIVIYCLLSQLHILCLESYRLSALFLRLPNTNRFFVVQLPFFVGVKSG